MNPKLCSRDNLDLVECSTDNGDARIYRWPVKPIGVVLQRLCEERELKEAETGRRTLDGVRLALHAVIIGIHGRSAHCRYTLWRIRKERVEHHSDIYRTKGFGKLGIA